MSSVQFPSQSQSVFRDFFSEIDIGGLERCIEDVRTNNQLRLENTSIPEGYSDLIKGLEEETPFLSEMYQQTIAYPLINYLKKRAYDVQIPIDRHSKEYFIVCDAIRAVFFHTAKCAYEYRKQTRTWRKAATIFSDQTLLYCRATRAAQAMLIDLYYGFLEYEEQAQVTLLKEHTVAPLYTWGIKERGPYILPIDATNCIEMKAALVSLPLENSQGGLLAWTTLAHEVSGHNLLHANIGLLKELKTVVSIAIFQHLPLVESSIGKIAYSSHLANYWSSKVGKVVSDVLGLLNLGPAAGLGLIGYFKSINKIRRLSSTDQSNDPHPADILRGLLAAEVVSRLSFSKNLEWGQIILQETLRDYPLKRSVSCSNSSNYDSILLGGVPVPYEIVRNSTGIVAETIMNKPLKCLENYCATEISLVDIRAWNNQDEKLVAEVRKILREPYFKRESYFSNNPNGYFAEHVIAAATIEALTSHSNISRIFIHMIDMFVTNSRYNPSWNKEYEMTQHKVPHSSSYKEG